jgi:hypothetical protein
MRKVVAPTEASSTTVPNAKELLGMPCNSIVQFPTDGPATSIFVVGERWLPLPSEILAR